MKLTTVSALRSTFLLGLLVANYSYADWANNVDPTVVRPLPTDARIQPQNPPGFSWSQHPTNPAAYVLELNLLSSTGTVVSTQTFTVTRNWLLPSATLAAGHYNWRVRPSTSTDWSTPREFYIDATSKNYVVPENAALQNYILSRARPRGLSNENLSQSGWSAGMAADRSPLLARLSAEVLGKVTSLAVPSDALWPLPNATVVTAALSAQQTSIRWTINDVSRQVEAAALVYRLTKDPRFKTEAIVRGNQLAALSPTGPTSFANQDQGSRQITLGLVKAIDFLGSDLDDTTRKAWLSVITVRANDIFKDIAGVSGRLDQQPFDSHGATNLGIMTVVATLTLGDIPAASDWFNYCFRAYVNSVSPWSGPEGGFGNGTAYAQYTADTSSQLWPVLRAATGVDLFAKPWSAGFVQFMAHFVPPGSPTHVFGDQHEVVPDVPTLKSFAKRVATPVAAWYVNNMVGTEDTLRELESPWPMAVSTAVAAPPANGAVYPSVGWAAMHSDITDRARTSIYFKSSPYGSYSHSHGDQNSIVINSGGRQLLMEAGYEDWYASPMWNNWYHQTKSHNAITYDGGIGQKVDGVGSALSWNGKVLSFSTSASSDFVSGDATAAYGGVLNSAIRQVWYFRASNVVVVQDKLIAPIAHSFEWNVHAPVVMSVGTDGWVAINNVDRSLCIRSVTPDAVFSKWVGGPVLAGKVEDHGAFIKPAATTAEFLMVLDVGCKKPVITYDTSGTSRVLNVGGNTITLPK